MNNNPNAPDLEPEGQPEPPNELAYADKNLEVYLDERYRMIAEVIELYLRYAEPQTRYNSVIGVLADELDMLATMLRYEDILRMTERLRAEEEILGDDNTFEVDPNDPLAEDDDDFFAGLDEGDLDESDGRPRF